MSKKVTLAFDREKVTKNAVRFQEQTEEPPVIGSLYVQKWFVGDAATLIVTVEVGETGKKR